jgi:hypothetical protein
MSINIERLQEIIESIYNIKEEMEVHHDETYGTAHELADQLQEELETIQHNLS